MLKKKPRVCVAICLISLLMLSACSKSGESEELARTAVETVQRSITKEIKDEVTINGKALIIDAPVELGNILEVSEIQLSFSEERLSRIVDDLIYSKYPNAIKDNSDPYVTNWISSPEAVLSAYLSAKKTGQVDYIDRSRDLECNLCETEHLLEDGFITELIPKGISLSAQAASEVATDFLTEYSCLDFTPWNILAANSNSSTSGYYYISMEASFNGIPICHKSNQGEAGINAYVLLSNEGIFQFGGMLLLEPVEIKSIEQLVPLCEIIGRIKENFSLIFSGDRIEIDKIALKYMPEQTSENTFCLRPAWCFSCTENRTNSDVNGKTEETKLRWEYVFYADDGSFCSLL